MKSNTRLFFYTLGGVVFTIGFVGMLIFGYKTFYVGGNDAPTKDYTYHIALIAEERDNPYWRLIEKGSNQAADEQDVYIEYVAPEAANNDTLLQLLDRMIAEKVDGILVQGVERQQFVDLVHKGMDLGIPIMTIDTDVENSERSMYVGIDNFHAGEQAGKELIANTSGKQTVGIVTGRMDSIGQQERVEGFKQAIKDTERIHFAGTEESNITEIGASKATYTLLKKHPDITALFGTSSLDGAGMVDGTQGIAPNKDLYMIAFDLLPKTLQLLKEGEIDATVAQYPEKIGYQSVNAMVRLQENNISKEIQHIGTTIKKKEDVIGQNAEVGDSYENN